MTTLYSRSAYILSSLLVAVVALVPSGCGPSENISSSNVPKSTEPRRGLESPPKEANEYRLFGAMFPTDSPAWFFKFSGPTDQISKYEADFDKLITSVSLPAGGNPPEFTVPEGWKRGTGRAGIVVATARTPDEKYELTITSAMGGVDSNLKRWFVDQLGNPSFGEAEKTKTTTMIDAKGVKGLRVDMRGPKNPATARGPFMGGGQ